MKVSVVMPALNEEKTIGILIKRLWKYADEIIVVDDASSDNTSRVARHFGAKVLRNNSSKGQMESISRGIKNSSGGVVITMDADLEHDPRYIPAMLKKLGKCDIVIGSRKKLPRISEQIISVFTRGRTGVFDSLSGFRAFQRDCAKIPIEGGYGALFLLRSAKKGFKISQVWIKSERRKNPRIGNALTANLKILATLPRIIFELIS